MKKSAFTLIELLVVIAIIAVLAGIALPVYNKVLERAHVTQDTSNMHQLGIGVVAYLNDNNDTYFSANTTVTNTSPGATSGGTLYAPGVLEVNYVTNTNVFQSPFDKRVPASSPANVSYGVNSNILGRTVPATAGQFTGDSTTLTSSSQLILFAPAYTGDPTVVANWAGYDNGPVQVSPPAGGGGGGVVPTTGTQISAHWINVVYADAHAASIKFTDFQSTTNNSTTGGINGAAQWYPLGVPP